MSDTNALNPAEPTELDMLKERAALMGITHSNNIGVEALRKKVDAKMEGQADTTDESGAEVPSLAKASVNALAVEQSNALVQPEPVVQKTLSQHLKDKAMKLVRIRISTMDPKKQDLQGEFFTVANDFIGTVRKHVPFGEQTDGGYHVPQCIYDLLKSREFLHVQTRTLPNGQIDTKTRWVKEFAIEVLPDLTRQELAAIAADQRATGRLEGED